MSRVGKIISTNMYRACIYFVDVYLLICRSGYLCEDIF
jgi:hypothetical protein